jgi:hypothetical protein
MGSRSNLVGVDTRATRNQQMTTDYIFSLKRGRETIKYRHNFGGEVSVHFKLELHALRGLSVPTNKNINY